MLRLYETDMKEIITHEWLELECIYIDFQIVTFLFSDNSDIVPPDPIPNSVVKCVSADGSVGVPMWE